MNNFFDHLFGTIAGGYSGLNKLNSGISFIPANTPNGNGKTIKIKGAGARWLGMRNRIMQKYAYEFCYPVAAVVDRLAEYDLTGELQILRSTGKGKDNFATNDWANRMNALLEQPNEMQSWEEFRGEQIVYKKIFGFCPVLPICPVGFESQPWMALALVNLPPWLFEAVPVRGSILSWFKKSNIVKEYRATINGSVTTFKPEQLMILTDGFTPDDQSDFLLPLSRLVGLDMAISNICAAMEADNVLLRKKGPLGFISHDATTKDQVSYRPMSMKYKKELQKSLTSYGLTWDQYQYVISRVASKWNPMSFSVKDLDTSGTLEKCEKAICHRLAFPYILYEETDTTYANGDNAAATVYQTNVIPNANKDAKKYAKFFQAKENACKLFYNFECVAALQEDKQYEATAGKTRGERLKEEWLNGVITLNQWREAQEYDTVDGDDIYYTEWKKKNQPEPPKEKVTEFDDEGNPKLNIAV